MMKLVVKCLSSESHQIVYYLSENCFSCSKNQYQSFGLQHNLNDSWNLLIKIQMIWLLLNKSRPSCFAFSRLVYSQISKLDRFCICFFPQSPPHVFFHCSFFSRVEVFNNNRFFIWLILFVCCFSIFASITSRTVLASACEERQRNL